MDQEAATDADSPEAESQEKPSPSATTTMMTAAATTTATAHPESTQATGAATTTTSTTAATITAATSTSYTADTNTDTGKPKPQKTTTTMMMTTRTTTAKTRQSTGTGTRLSAGETASTKAAMTTDNKLQPQKKKARTGSLSSNSCAAHLRAPPLPRSPYAHPKAAMLCVCVCWSPHNYYEYFYGVLFTPLGRARQPYFSLVSRGVAMRSLIVFSCKDGH